MSDSRSFTIADPASGALTYAKTPVAADLGEASQQPTSEVIRRSNSWREVSKTPKKIARVLHVEVQKHTIRQSGAPFEKRRPKRRPATRR